MNANVLDLSDELLERIYDHLNFTERQVTRRVCRRLWQFVDESTAGAKELQVTAFPALSSSDSVSMKPSRTDAEKVDLMLGFVEPPSEGEDMLPKLRTKIPPLRSIRPKKVSLHDLFAPLMQLFVEQQVATSVTSIELHQSLPFGPAAQVQQVCRNFDQMSQSGVNNLTIRGGDSSLRSVPFNFPRLVSLTCLGIAQGMVRELERLSSHRTLRELFIRNVVYFRNQVPLMNTLATFANLRKFEFNSFFHGNQGERFDREFEAFANMMNGMTSLECLRTLHNPPGELWQRLADRGIESRSLQELKVYFGEFLELPTFLEAVTPMVDGLGRFAPSLTTLCLDATLRFWVRLDEEQVELFVSSFEGLSHHPALKKLELTENIMHSSLLQRRLGPRIKVVVVPKP